MLRAFILLGATTLAPAWSPYATHGRKAACPPRAAVPCLEAPPAATDDALEFPRPLTAFERLQRQLTFTVQVLPVIGAYLRLYSSIQLRERLLTAAQTGQLVYHDGPLIDIFVEEDASPATAVDLDALDGE